MRHSPFLLQCINNGILIRNAICLIKRLSVRYSHPLCCCSKHRIWETYLVNLGIPYFPQEGKVWQLNWRGFVVVDMGKIYEESVPSSILQAQDYLLILQGVVLPSSGIQTGWRNGLTRTLQRWTGEVTGSAPAEEQPHATALERSFAENNQVSWWMPSCPEPQKCPCSKG